MNRSISENADFADEVLVFKTRRHHRMVSHEPPAKFDEEEYVDGLDSIREPLKGVSPYGNDSQCLMPADSKLNDGHSSTDEQFNRPVSQHEVIAKTVLGGVCALLTGRNKASDNVERQEYGTLSDVSFLTSGKDGDTCLHPSVYVPSAPPLLGAEAVKDVLDAEPPEWLPDSHTNACMQCTKPFTVFTRGRHHCRFCGGLFCRACTKGRCLMPPNFRLRDPQRVCDTCYDRLDPLQDMLINSVSNAVQRAKHDVLDWTCVRGWLNLPFGFSMEHEIYKASNALRNYYQTARLNPEKSIPHAVLRGASGLAILTVAKVGALLTYKLGTGLVVARRMNGTWSAPSAILSCGLGWGAQVGGELTDYIIVLHGFNAVNTFCGQMHFSLGAGISAAAGPVGRVFEADIRAGDRGSGMCYTYSCSKGAFIGVSLEGNVVMTRMDANLRFYGDPYITTDDILMGNVARPVAAQPLYSSLDDVYSRITI